MIGEEIWSLVDGQWLYFFDNICVKVGQRKTKFYGQDDTRTQVD